MIRLKKIKGWSIAKKTIQKLIEKIIERNQNGNYIRLRKKVFERIASFSHFFCFFQQFLWNCDFTNTFIDHTFHNISSCIFNHFEVLFSFIEILPFKKFSRLNQIWNFIGWVDHGEWNCFQVCLNQAFIKFLS